ncbi:hypothetical protein CsatB_028744 [Cannabis sativa]
MDDNGWKKRAKSTSMVGGEDRISKLTDSVILHILSFLPTDQVVKTCILSKRWKLIWYAVPTLFFSNDIASELEWKQSRQKFYSYVDKYLKHRKKAMYYIVDSVITSFDLDMYDFYQRSKAGVLDKWLAFAIENKVKELHLRIGLERKNNRFYPEYYCLPKVVENGTYLTVLELKCLELDSSHSFSFPFLKALSLEEIQQSDKAKDDVVFKFLLGCRCLEKLRLHKYEFLRSGDKIPLQSLSLKFLELTYTTNLDGLQVEAINLESLVITCRFPSNIDFSACKKIRNLSFDGTVLVFDAIKPPSLNALISYYPLLENLTLTFKPKQYEKHLRISSQQLKSFSLKNCHFEPCNITIESVPKLSYFCYEGYIDLTISIEPSNSLSGKIVICKEDYDAAWYIDMLNFLLNLNCSWNTISLHVEECEALIWPEKFTRVCRSPLLNWKHLKVITKCNNPEIISDLKDSLMWISPSLETLSINKMQIF